MKLKKKKWNISHENTVRKIEERKKIKIKKTELAYNLILQEEIQVKETGKISQTIIQMFYSVIKEDLKLSIQNI